MNKSGFACPRCNSVDVFRSRRRGLIDRLMSMFGFYPYICEEHECRKRFYRRARGGAPRQHIF